MVLRHVSILKDHPQGVCLYLAKVTELFKRFEELSPTHGTTKAHNTHLIQYCCHNAGINHRDFKFSVFKFKKFLKSFK